MLSRKKVAFTTRDLFKQPLTAAEIRALAARAPDGVRGLLSTRTAQYKALGLDKKNPGDEALKALKVIIKPIPDDTLSDLAAYYSSLK